MATKLPSYISNLPTIGKKLFVKAYQLSKDSGLTEQDSIDGAMFAIGERYQKTDVASMIQSFNMQTALIKEGGIFNKSYFFDAVLSSSLMDKDKHEVSKTLLKHLSDIEAIDIEGDIFHKAFNGETGLWQGLVRKINQTFDGSKLHLRFAINKSHEKYKEFLELHKQKPFTHLSAEFYSPQLMGNKIVFANRLGWTLTNGERASNADAKIEW